MTSREVIDNLFHGRGAGRVGLNEYFWEDTLAAWVQQGYPTRRVRKEVGDRRWRAEDGRWVPAETAGEYEQPVPAWEHFGYDMSEPGPRFEPLPLLGEGELEQETGEWTVRRNGAGAALKFWKHKSGTPEHVDFRMVTRQIWERDYRPHLVEWNPARFRMADLRRGYGAASAAQKWIYYGNYFVWELARQSMGDVTLYESLLLDPGWIHDYCRVYTDLFVKCFSYMIQEVGKPNGILLAEDLGYKNGLFAGPSVLAELIFPYYKELIDWCHRQGLAVILHCCGSVPQALPLIVEAGFDALHPIERKAQGNDPLAFAERYGERIAFVGGLDARVLETNDRDTIRREVSGYVEGMKARGARLVFGSDHSISPNVRYESYAYALQVYREHMTY